MEKAQSPEIQVFRHTIAVEALPRLEGMVAEHNRRVSRLAKRHGIVIAPATMKVVRTFEAARTVEGGAEIKTWKAEVEVSGQQAKIEGWQILGSLVSTDAGYLLSPIGRNIDLTSYKDRGGQCDHCKTVRARAVTYILGQDSTIKLVGSACLKDFTGHLSPSAMAQYAQACICFENEIKEMEEEEDGEQGGGGIRQRQAVGLPEFLSFVASSIRTDGWVSRTQAAGSNKRATADMAWMDLQAIKNLEWRKEQILLGAIGEQLKAKAKLMLDTYSTDGMIDRSKLVGLTAGDVESTERACHEAILADARIEAAKWDKEMDARRPTPADVVKASEDIELVEESFGVKEARDDYEEKILSVISQGYAFDKNIGLAASICVAADRVRRDLAREEARKLEKDEFFGEPGKRTTFTLRLVYTQSIDSEYGRSYLHIFLDAEGRKAKWFSSRECLDKGSYEIKATVKNHEIYQGRKITQLSRCKVVRELTAEAMACPF